MNGEAKPELVPLNPPERKRTYHFPKGEKVELENVTHLLVKPSARTASSRTARSGSSQSDGWQSNLMWTIGRCEQFEGEAMNPVIFFDLDGVLCDFVRGALMYHGRMDIHPSRVKWGIEAQLGLEPAAFWRDLGFGFWSALSPYTDGFALLDAAEKLVGIERIGLLTSPCDTAGCVDGKRAWVAKHLQRYSRRLLVGSAKELFAHRTAILVDDHDANVAKFVTAGGKTVQPPRPWNQLAHQCDHEGGFDVAEVAGMLAVEVLRAKA